MAENANKSGIALLARPQFRHRILFYFITLVAIVVIYFKFSEIQLLKQVFLRSNTAWLIGIILTQVLSYFFIALNYRDVLRVKDLNLSLKELYPMTFVVQFLNQALPSAGVSGQAYFVQFLKKYGLTVAEGISRALVEIMTLYMAFGTFFIAALVLMFTKGVFDNHPEVLFLVYFFIFLAIVFIGIYIALQSKRRGRVMQWFVHKLHGYFEKKKKDTSAERTSHLSLILDELKNTLNARELRKRGKAFWLAYLWQNVVLLLNVLTLYFISYAVGFEISFSAAFIIFILTKFIAMLAFVPGALGVFEGSMTLMLVSLGVPAAPAFAITMLFRAFTFWFPMPVGWLIYRYQVHRHEIENPDFV